jgi:tetraacyldisaccharide 4'-kinase
VKAPEFWAKEPTSLVARLLQPIGAVYGAMTARRMAQPGQRAMVPVVCIGNFIAGGAGKTPAAIAVAKLLIGMGEKVAFLSRGYGGAGAANPIAVDLARHSAADVSDEPLLLACVAPCFVARDRVRGAAEAAASGASVLVLDDGLQNPSLAKDFALAMIDGGYAFGNGLCLPAGPLRAPPGAQWPFVSRAIVVDAPDRAGKAWRVVEGKPAMGARLVPDDAVREKLKGRSVLAFAGIGRPEKFFVTLTELGARVVVARGFADHHPYARSELDGMFAEAERNGLAIVTTEKDLVRLPVYYRERTIALPVTLRFDDEQAVVRLLAEALARRRESGA